MTTDQQSKLLEVENRILRLLAQASDPNLMGSDLGAKHAAGALRMAAQVALNQADDLWPLEKPAPNRFGHWIEETGRK